MLGRHDIRVCPCSDGRPMTDNGILPKAGPDDAFFWEGLRRGKALLQKCLECERVRFPPSPRCTSCGAAHSATVEASGGGSVYSWIVANRAFHPDFSASVPFILATIDLDEGARIAGELRTPTESVHAGLRVRIAFEPIEEFVKVSFVAEDAAES